MNEQYQQNKILRPRWQVMDGAQNLAWCLDGRLKEIGVYGVTLLKGHHRSRAFGTRGLWACGHRSSASSLQGRTLQHPSL